MNAFMVIYFLTFNIYKYAFPLFLIYSFDNDDMKSSKRHVVLITIVNFLAERFLRIVVFYKLFITNLILLCATLLRFGFLMVVGLM